MEHAGRMVTWIVIAILVIGGGYYYWQSTKNAPASLTSSGAESATPTNQPTLASGSDTSDAGLEKDMSGMDSGFSAMSEDTASIYASLQDTPVTQDDNF